MASLPDRGSGGTKNNILDYLPCVKSTLSSGYFMWERPMGHLMRIHNHSGASLNDSFPPPLDTAPCAVQTLSWGSYLHVAAPLGFPFQQGIQDSPAGLLSSRVIPTHHVVGWPHSLEKFDINILTIAVIGNIAQVQIHRGAWRHSWGLGRLGVSWSFGKQTKRKARVTEMRRDPLVRYSFPTHPQEGPAGYAKGAFGHFSLSCKG